MKRLYLIPLFIILLFNLHSYSQTSPPWDFNGTDHGFISDNYSEHEIGETFLTYVLVDDDDDGNAQSAYPNLKNDQVQINTSLGNYIAITLQNLTDNARLQVITTGDDGNQSFTSFDGLSSNDSDFVTHYINMSSNANWSGTLGAINFRFKQGNGVNNNVYAGNILIDHIEVVDAIPATPRIDYTFDDTSDSEGFAATNGVTLSQPLRENFILK